MSQELREDAIQRMRSAKGHLEGVLRMLEDPGAHSRDVLKQLSAVQGALGKINMLLLSLHVHEQVTTAVRRGNAEGALENVMEALKYRR